MCWHRARNISSEESARARNVPRSGTRNRNQKITMGYCLGSGSQPEQPLQSTIPSPASNAGADIFDFWFRPPPYFTCGLSWITTPPQSASRYLCWANSCLFRKAQWPCLQPSMDSRPYGKDSSGSWMTSISLQWLYHGQWRARLPPPRERTLSGLQMSPRLDPL
jgi:hypothetical protein